MLEYWDLAEEIDRNRIIFDDPPVKSAPFYRSTHSLSRSSSADTIRPSSYYIDFPPPSPRPPHIDLTPDPKGSSLLASVASAISTTWLGGTRLELPFIPATDEEFHLRSSRRIHDGHIDLNFAYDYKAISIYNLKRHGAFLSIQKELMSSAHAMGNEDIKRGYYHPNDKPLMPRHVESLLHRLPDVFGNMREPYVALLELIALSGNEIKIISINKLCVNQTKMYQQVANELEWDMRVAYNKARLK
ncbi:hypothetical protein DXG01_002022 [Tephrocybe rancida]|nr:hypothetical protein DXG01_002022 [Tephrocybe rancida]